MDTSTGSTSELLVSDVSVKAANGQQLQMTIKGWHPLAESYGDAYKKVVKVNDENELTSSKQHMIDEFWAAHEQTAAKKRAP